MNGHKPSRFGGELLIIRSQDCDSLSDTGAVIHFQPTRPIVAQHGLRLLFSLQQATYSKSIANVTESNQLLVFRYDSRSITCLIPLGLYRTGSALAVAVQGTINEATPDPTDDRITVGFSETTAHFTFQRARGGEAFEMRDESTAVSLLGFSNSQLNVETDLLESAFAADLAPCSAFLVRIKELSCSAIESQNASAGGGIVARVPTIGLLTTGFVRESWAPFNPHHCLLHERVISGLTVELVDSDTFELIQFTDKRAWHLVFNVEYVHTPDAITRAAVDSEIGLKISYANTGNLDPDAVPTSDRSENIESKQSGLKSGTTKPENRQKSRRRRGGSRRTKR